MDFDASPVLYGECTQDEQADRLMDYVVQVAKGNLSKGEELGHREYFVPYKYQEKKLYFENVKRQKYRGSGGNHGSFYRTAENRIFYAEMV